MYILKTPKKRNVIGWHLTNGIHLTSTARDLKGWTGVECLMRQRRQIMTDSCTCFLCAVFVDVKNKEKDSQK